MKKNTKKTILIVIIVIAVTTLLALSVNAISSVVSDESLFTKLGNALRSKDDSVIATIDNEKITKREFEIKKSMLELEEAKTYSDSEILDIIIKEKVMVIEAKKHDLYPSNKEIDEIREREQNSFENKLEENEAFIKEIGVTRNEIIEYFVDLYVQDKFKGELLLTITTQLYDGNIKTSDSKVNDALNLYKSHIEDIKNGGKVDAKYGLDLFNAYIEYITDHSNVSRKK